MHAAQGHKLTRKMLQQDPSLADALQHLLCLESSLPAAKPLVRLLLQPATALVVTTKPGGFHAGGSIWQQSQQGTASGSMGAWWVHLAALSAGEAPHLTGLLPRGEVPRGERPVGLLPRGEAPVGRPPVT